ncbi:hypothetical protein F3Y22_tig00112124pilonHSYRG00045 [Hibiscus syriacus]|uniref:ALOG domain-containing protein n=1 Tax=Hibiscus syriacus TaxID=106335 RepID=A0A6A2X6L2_HIBSY|nr:hypothetical protein F3Y22_tig00112124pilonHSYRG00045 [Hibiscus syriacus]
MDSLQNFETSNFPASLSMSTMSNANTNNTNPSPAAAIISFSPPPTSSTSSSTTISRYENQKRRDWNTFGQYLRNHRPPLSSPAAAAPTFSNSSATSTSSEKPKSTLHCALSSVTLTLRLHALVPSVKLGEASMLSSDASEPLLRNTAASRKQTLSELELLGSTYVRFVIRSPKQEA